MTPLDDTFPRAYSKGRGDLSSGLRATLNMPLKRSGQSPRRLLNGGGFFVAAPPISGPKELRYERLETPDKSRP